MLLYTAGRSRGGITFVLNHVVLREKLHNCIRRKITGLKPLTSNSIERTTSVLCIRFNLQCPELDCEEGLMSMISMHKAASVHVQSLILNRQYLWTLDRGCISFRSIEQTCSSEPFHDHPPPDWYPTRYPLDLLCQDSVRSIDLRMLDQAYVTLMLRVSPSVMIFAPV